eukprot:4856533-Pleurochrysis_carterae.AAC.1
MTSETREVPSRHAGLAEIQYSSLKIGLAPSAVRPDTPDESTALTPYMLHGDERGIITVSIGYVVLHGRTIASIEDTAISSTCIRTTKEAGNQNVREDEEQALRHMISGIIPEWKEVSVKEKRGTIEIMKLWTGDMMNWARIFVRGATTIPYHPIQMENWMDKKYEHRAR